MSFTKILRPCGAVLLAAALAACGSSSQATSVQQPKPVVANDPSCPVTVPGTSVTVEDTDTGSALVFVTTSDAAELRKRVASMAQMHNDQHAAMGPLPDETANGGEHAGHDMGGGHANMGSGEHAGHDMSGGKHAGHAGGMITVHSKATTAAVEGGAKIVFAAGSAEVSKLQGELRMHAKHLSSGTCEMTH